MDSIGGRLARENSTVEAKKGNLGSKDTLLQEEMVAAWAPCCLACASFVPPVLPSSLPLVLQYYTVHQCRGTRLTPVLSWEESMVPFSFETTILAAGFARSEDEAKPAW